MNCVLDQNDFSALAELLATTDAVSVRSKEKISELLNQSSSSNTWFGYKIANKLCAAAHVTSDEFASGTWIVNFVVVRPDQQNRGIGKALLKYIEFKLRTGNHRRLLVHSYGKKEYSKYRHLCLRLGYICEGIVNDYYENGNDKITYSRVIAR
ncbi:hypothetical protein BIY21_19970 [Vibrio ponticus]|uniref:N-acetyltransferase domain-containing protein n=1 Tax=Vibrio ponticus TaxID=265668 RepID=A0ABX3F423_9VIBR|nr:GNAT family N-acetyltransferase [Vibrio ponticus]OLQ84676.1 hypothetical protein BIY21_19970 [Vibrio ponticus]